MPGYQDQYMNSASERNRRSLAWNVLELQRLKRLGLPNIRRCAPHMWVSLSPQHIHSISFAEVYEFTYSSISYFNRRRLNSVYWKLFSIESMEMLEFSIKKHTRTQITYFFLI